MCTGTMFNMQLWDTAGQEEFSEARKVCYKGCNVLLIAFNIANPDSFDNVKNVWIKEAKSDGLNGAPVGHPPVLHS